MLPPELFLELEPVYAARGDVTLDRSWRLPDRPFPISLTEEEGALLRGEIVKRGVRHGFEVATGFGMSSFYAGEALHSLVSLDCYSEERASAVISPASPPYPLWEPAGLRFALRWRDRLGIGVRYAIGSSPQDVPALAVGAAPFDYAFIDGGHQGVQPTLDVVALLPFLAAHGMLAFHDVGSGATLDAVGLAVQRLGGEVYQMATRHNLTFVVW